MKMKKTMFLALAVLGMVLGTIAEARSAPCDHISSNNYGCHVYNCPSGCVVWVCPNPTNPAGPPGVGEFCDE